MKRKTFNGSLHLNINDKGFGLVKVPSPKNLVVKSTKFPLRNLHISTWTASNGKTHTQIDCIIIDSKWLSSIVDLRKFSGADCDTNHYLVTEMLAKDGQ